MVGVSALAGSGQREPRGEAAAAAVRLCLDLTAHRAREPSSEREPEPGAIPLVSIARGAATTGFKDRLALLRRDATAVIGDGEKHGPVAALDAHRHAMLAIAAAVLDQRGKHPLGDVGVQAHP